MTLKTLRLTVKTMLLGDSVISTPVISEVARLEDVFDHQSWEALLREKEEPDRPQRLASVVRRVDRPGESQDPRIAGQSLEGRVVNPQLPQMPADGDGSPHGRTRRKL
jgi:hypothetical protein